MPNPASFERKSANRLAFEHYLRTGQKLSAAEWEERQERKFNPNHDERGRFTFALVVQGWPVRHRRRGPVKERVM